MPVSIRRFRYLRSAFAGFHSSGPILTGLYSSGSHVFPVILSPFFRLTFFRTPFSHSSYPHSSANIRRFPFFQFQFFRSPFSWFPILPPHSTVPILPVPILPVPIFPFPFVHTYFSFNTYRSYTYFLAPKSIRAKMCRIDLSPRNRFSNNSLSLIIPRLQFVTTSHYNTERNIYVIWYTVSLYC